MSKPTCLISGPVFNRSGYGDWATDIAKSMLRYDKYDLMIAPQKWGHCPSKRFIDDITDIEEKILATKMLQGPLQKQPDLFIQLTIPEEFQPVGKFNIGMTAGIETTIPPGSWIEGINRMNLTIGLSKHVKDIFESVKMSKNLPNGQQVPIQVEKPIEVCSWGANTNIFKKTDEKVDSIEEIMSTVKEKQAFLFVGQWTHQGLYHDRKDIGNLIKTFCKAFKDSKEDNRPALILKTSGVNYSTVDRYDMIHKIKTVRQSVSDNSPNVYLIHGELDNVEMNALMNHEKVIAHVSFTHGEGYGHPLLLATLSGKPVLAPDWSGHVDFMNKEYASFLPGTLEQVNPKSVNQWIIKESKWFNVSYTLAEDKLKQIYNHRGSEKLKNKAESLRLENMEKFSLPAMDKQFWGILDKYVPQFAVENKFVLPKLKMVGSEDSTKPSDEQKIVLPKLKLV